MNIKDELDAMLDGLKNGGTNTDAQKESPKPVRKIPPRKSAYDNMSVDELVQALSGTKKQNNLKVNTTASVPPKTTAETENGIPKNLIDMLSLSDSGTSQKKVVSNNLPAGRKAVIKSTAAPVSHNSAKDEKNAAISEALQEHKAVNHSKTKISEPVTAKVDNSPADLPENSVLIRETPETAAEHEKEVYEAPDELSDSSLSEEDFHTAETSAEPDDDIAAAAPTEEAAPKRKRILFSRLKAKFSKKTDAAENCAPISNSESASEINSELQSDDASMNMSETDVEREDSESASAAELIDAALAANEEVQMEISGESAPTEINNVIPDTDNTEPDDNVSDEPITDIHNDDAADISESDDRISDAADDSSHADGLIADIRKDAAEAIAEISDGKPQETVRAEAPEETDDKPETPVDIDVSVDGQNKKGRFVKALEKILEENPGTIADERSEKAEPDEIDVSVDKHGSGKLKKRLYAVFGVVFTALAVVGLVSSVKFGLSHFRSFTAGENKKDSFSDVIYPAVIMDIESFSSPSELSSEQIISAAIWSLVMSADDMEKYEKTFDVISVPAVDVEAYAARLFGDAMPTLTHTTVGSGELKFYYNEETKSYNVPINPITFTYEPSITSVSKTDNEYTVTVDYIKELPAWMKNSENFSPDVSKTVEFKLAEKDGSYVISSMTVINVNSAIVI